jgi:protoporphyrinogen oxidase
MSSAPDVVILGGGLCGLSAALYLSEADVRWTLLEKESRVGGHARTDETRGFFFDKTGHWLHLRDPGIQQLVAELLPDQMVRVERKARIFSHGALTRFPFQANLYGLPPAVVSECLLEFLAAHERSASASPPANFEDFCLQKFGSGISRHFMIPYNQKLWGVHPREITAEWCSRFVPIPKLEDVVRGAVGDVPPEMGYNIAFLYPREGGIETLTRALTRRVVEHKGSSELHVSTGFESIEVGTRTLAIGGERRPYRAIVATLPMPELIRRVSDAPKEVEEAAARLRCTPVRYLNVATKTSPRAEYHWIYVPEERYPFYRVGIYTNAVPKMAPEGHGSLYVELSDRRPGLRLDDVMPDVTQALHAAGAINAPDDVLFAELKELTYAYVVFDEHYYASVNTITRWLEQHDIYPRGRYGSWIYNSMEDSLMAGRDVARHIAAQPLRIG